MIHWPYIYCNFFEFKNEFLVVVQITSKFRSLISSWDSQFIKISSQVKNKKPNEFTLRDARFVILSSWENYHVGVTSRIHVSQETYNDFMLFVKKFVYSFKLMYQTNAQGNAHSLWICMLSLDGEDFFRDIKAIGKRDVKLGVIK